jgi:hypothetical protein
VDKDLESSVYDHQIDSHPRRPSTGLIGPVAGYQRLLVNPFLSLLTWVAVALLIRVALRLQNLTLFLAGVVLLFVPLVLLRFHCLDCGDTGWLLSSWRHACPSVVQRWHSRQVARFRLPGVGTQLVAWFYLVVTILSLSLIVIVSRR